MKLDIAGTQIYITQNVIEIFKQYRQIETRNIEMGGIVLGQVDLTSERVLICRASIPNLSDKFDRLFFNRDQKIAQLMIDYENLNSQGYNTYLGEWHTHPTIEAHPSSQDLEMIKEQFFKNEIRTNFIFLIIVSQRQLYIGRFDGLDLVFKSLELK